MQRSPLPEVSDRCTGTLDRCASTRIAPDPLPARGLHTPQPLGATGSAEQEDPLRSPVPHQCRNPSRSRSPSETPRRRDWLLQRVHTWSQKLKIHPHVHCVVPAGGLSPDHARWVRSRDNYFLPKEVLREVFRGKFVDALEQAFHNGQLNFQGDLKLLAQPKIFAAWLRPLYRQDWLVYLKRPFGGPQSVLQYRGPSTHPVAISNHRLVSLTDGQVTFRWRDSAHHNEQKLLPLSLNEFLCRFLLHVLPQGFVRIRNFGFLANRKRATLLPLCFQLLGSSQQPQAEQQHASSTEDGPDLWRCPKCGGPMKVIERLTAAEIQLRSPPRISVAA